jgi:hypothetical protein
VTCKPEGPECLVDETEEGRGTLIPAITDDVPPYVNRWCPEGHVKWLLALLRRAQSLRTAALVPYAKARLNRLIQACVDAERVVCARSGLPRWGGLRSAAKFAVKGKRRKTGNFP